MVKILFINAAGAGFADRIEVEDGTTVQKLFEQKLPDDKPANFNIRLRRGQSIIDVVAADEVLQDGDRVSVTMTKIDGAC